MTLSIDSSNILSDVIVNLDENKFGQVITNLIGNALKFTSRGGLVAVSVTLVEASRLVKINIADTGVGITSVIILYIHDVSLAPTFGPKLILTGGYQSIVPRCGAVFPWHASAGGRSWVGPIQYVILIVK